MVARTEIHETGSDVVETINPSGRSDIVLVCEHGSSYMPPEFGGLGLDRAALTSHIAWDPGALELARGLSAHFDAPLVVQKVSRLIYDCNRPPGALGAMPAQSAGQSIPGNSNLSAADRADRTARFYDRFHDELTGVIEARLSKGGVPVLVTVHSFTPVYMGVRRDVQVGILHDDDTRLADRMLAAAKGSGRDVRRNCPYGPEDGVTHTLKSQGVNRGLANVMIEVRNDLIATRADQESIAAWLAGLIKVALADPGPRTAPQLAAGAAK
ncbi:MAG: N-formylglutamate amidohydrolase [Alphaproteobacteria bacterium]|nr:N-formylglutamate amidohydrolase [Alphaproteobacteria bacterium]